MKPVAEVVDEPERPTHFREDENVRVPKETQGMVDYATVEPVVPAEYGYLPAPDSTPVYLTEPPPVVRPIRKWQADRYVVDNASAEPIKILGNDRNRMRAVIANMDAVNSVYLTPFPQNKNIMFAREVKAAEDVEMYHNSAVWAFSLVGTPVLTMHMEYETNPKS